MDFKKLSTKEKALKINLDARIYGSFAEIGAGQDVAANFFKAGGASGTIAKTMSAYDMAFSDAIYGPEESGRYVCESRLLKMLDKEYGLLDRRLANRAARTCFFAFANTIEALNFQRTNEGRGWIGLRFQLNPLSPPNDCIVHIRLKDNDNLLQQQAVGIIGVNLIYACYYLFQTPEQLLLTLMDELSVVRAEIDFFRLDGPDFKHVDNRLFSLKLVKHGLTRATMFGPDGEVLQPAEVLYKKNILVMRGRFRPVTHVNIDMFERGLEEFRQEPDVQSENIIPIAELTLSSLTAGNDNGEILQKDFLDRVDILCSLGFHVMISNYQEYYRLVNYLSRFSRKRKIGMIMGVYNLQSIFEEHYYQDVPGGILEAFGSLFGHNVKLFVYPSFRRQSDEIITSDDIELPSQLRHLFAYMRENHKIEDLANSNTEHLHIISDEVLKMIRSGQDGWEKFVPEKVAAAIKADCLFDYPCVVWPAGRPKVSDK